MMRSVFLIQSMSPNHHLDILRAEAACKGCSFTETIWQQCHCRLPSALGNQTETQLVLQESILGSTQSTTEEELIAQHTLIKQIENRHYSAHNFLTRLENGKHGWGAVVMVVIASYTISKTLWLSLVLSSADAGLKIWHGRTTRISGQRSVCKDREVFKSPHRYWAVCKLFITEHGCNSCLVLDMTGRILTLRSGVRMCSKFTIHDLRTYCTSGIDWT